MHPDNPSPCCSQTERALSACIYLVNIMKEQGIYLVNDKWQTVLHFSKIYLTKWVAHLSRCSTMLFIPNDTYKVGRDCKRLLFEVQPGIKKLENAGKGSYLYNQEKTYYIFGTWKSAAVLGGGSQRRSIICGGRLWLFSWPTFHHITTYLGVLFLEHVP